MNESDVQSCTLSQRKCGRFRISLRLTAEGSLMIKASSDEEMEYYQALIGQEYIDNQDGFRNILESPCDILQCLMHEEDQVIVDSGSLQFTYRYGQPLLKKKKFTIKLQKQEINQEKIIQMRIERLERSMAVSLMEHTKSMEKMKEQVKLQMKNQVQKQVQFARNQLKNQKNDLQKSARSSFCHDLKKLKAGLQKEGQISNTLREQLQEISKTAKEAMRTSANLIKELVRNFQEFKKESSLSKQPKDISNNIFIGHHQGNTHKSFFLLINTGKASAIILPKGQSKLHYNFVNMTEILPSMREKYMVNIRKNTHMYIGFCTVKGLGQCQNYLNSDSIYYSCTGKFNLFEDGKELRVNSGLRGCQDYDVIECEANLEEGTFRWWRNDELIIERKINQGLKGKSVYFSLVMTQKASEAEISRILI